MVRHRGSRITIGAGGAGTMVDANDARQISAEPTKAFFVEMLTRDIPLEQAILDLVDNCVDGAKRSPKARDMPFEGYRVVIEFSRERFRIFDNCGGFGTNTARDYAFRFGRPTGTPRTAHSIGQFGVGMKRALFKFGHHFVVRSATADETWSMDVDVDKWEGEPGWNFPWADFEGDGTLSSATPGTEIVVTKLRPEVGSRFSTNNFHTLIAGLIKSKHRQFISGGLSISLNGSHLDATNLYLIEKDGLRAGTDELVFDEPNQARVTASIIVGVGQYSSPKDAGWYVVCNGRVVLEADRRPVTGWGLIEDEANKILIPSFHNQFARFRGVVSFDSEDSSRVPWNTTKTDVDQDSPVWQKTFARMIEMMRPVINFLNELDADIDEHSREHSPLLDFISTATVATKPEALPKKATFHAPTRGSIIKGPRTVKIQYSRNVDDIDFLQDALGVTSAKAVGERTFDLVLKRQRGE